MAVLRTLRLRDNARVVPEVIEKVMLHTRILFATDRHTFQALLCLCNNPYCHISDAARDRLASYGFFDDDGMLRLSVTSVVTSAVRGEGGGMYLASPLAEECFLDGEKSVRPAP